MLDAGVLSGLIHCVVLAGIGVVVLRTTRDDPRTVPFQVRLFLSALGVRFLAAVVIYQLGFVDTLKDEDGSGWIVGSTLSREWQTRGVGLLGLPGVWAESYTQLHKGYWYLLGTMFYLTDNPTRLAAAALNCFCGAMTIVLAYRTARLLFSPRVAVRVGWWTCFIPSMIIWSAQTVKEPVVILLETVALYCCVRIRLGKAEPRHLVLSVLAVALLVPIRLYAAGVTAVILAVSLALPPSAVWRRRTIPGLRVAALIVLYAVGSAALAHRQAEAEWLDLSRLESFRTGLAEGQGSGVEAGQGLGTASGFTSSLLFGGAHLLLAPFPWQLAGGSLRMLLVAPEMLVWWWLLFRYLGPGLGTAIRTRLGEVLPVLMFVVSLGLFYSLTFGNVGLVYRQRAQLMPWLLMFAAVGMERTSGSGRKEHVRNRRDR